MQWNSIIIALIASVPPTLMGLAAVIVAMRSHKRSHKLVNSRMDELLKTAIALATAKEKARSYRNKKQSHRNKKRGID